MTGDDKRREARYKASIPVLVIRGKETVSLTTEDVSFRGVFVKMDLPPALRQLVRLEVSLPEGATLKVHAMVVFRVPPGGAAVAGAGMQFYGLEGRERAQWDGFVQSVRDLLPKSTPDPAVEPVSEGSRAPLAAIDDRREFERHAVRFEVRVSTVDELRTLYTRDISKGGMAVETDMDLAPGTDVGLDLVHPRTGKAFELEATVRRKIRQPGASGLAVQFKSMTPARREELERFIASSGSLPPRA
jgi:PilZ domain